VRRRAEFFAALNGSRVLVVPSIVNNNRKQWIGAEDLFSQPQVGPSTCPGRSAARAISAFTRVFDALWRSGALQTRDRYGPWRSQSVAVPDQRCTTRWRSRCIASGTRNISDAFVPLFTFQTAHLVPAAHFCARGLQLCFAHPNRGVGGAPRDVRVRARHPLGLHMTRQARRLRGALRPIARQDARERAYDAGRSPLGAPPWRFWAPGAALLSPAFAPDRLQRAPRTQVVVPGGRGPEPPEASGYGAARRGTPRLAPHSGSSLEHALNERGWEWF
jgi:hypothetical protein